MAASMGMRFLLMFTLMLICVDSFKIKNKKNSHVIFKKLSHIELDENTPIGYLIIDLKVT